MSVQLSGNGTNAPVTVSASELVRNFGEWQDRALNRPVFINKRGRSRLVLMATELLNDARDGNGNDPTDMIHSGHPVIDALPLPVLMMDDALTIRWHNRAGHDLFTDGDAPLTGRPFASIGLFSGNDYVAAMLRRVAVSRMADAVEMTIGGDGRARQLALTAQPVANGVALIARDMGTHHALAAAQAALVALDDALAILPGVAMLRINPRGYCIGSSRSLTAMTGLTGQALEEVRIASLFDVRSRVTVTDAVNAVFADAAPRIISANLLANGHEPIGVALAFGSITSGSAIVAVQAVMARLPNDKIDRT